MVPMWRQDTRDGRTSLGLSGVSTIRAGREQYSQRVMCVCKWWTRGCPPAASHGARARGSSARASAKRHPGRIPLHFVVTPSLRPHCATPAASSALAMAEAGASRAPGIDFALRESAAGHARLEAACKTVLEVRRTGPAARAMRALSPSARALAAATAAAAARASPPRPPHLRHSVWARTCAARASRRRPRAWRARCWR